MVQVKIEEGILEGEKLNNEYGKPYYSFKGIPYAEPPVGELRFKPPKPSKPWDGVRPAKEFGPISYQIDFINQSTAHIGSEDCLYINVYSPDLEPSKPLPVMFWIHLGDYLWGSGNDNLYSPKFLIRKDVIIVTFNFRLGILGFLSLDTEDVAGNAGMKDQVLALKWVKRNISNFGGDPNNVTIFGQNAGGTSASFHLVSPMSKGLFKRAIIQSGSMTCPWACSPFHRQRAEKLAKKLGFHSDNDKELYEFFKNQSPDKLIDLTFGLPITLARKIYGDTHVAVVSEKDFGNNERFFYGDIYDCLRNGIHEGVEVLMGYTEHEGIVAIAFNECRGDLDKFYSYANDYVEFFVPKIIALNCPLAKQMELGKKIKKFYMKDKIVSKDSIDEVLKFVSMDFCAFDTVVQAKFLAKKNKTYLYKFTCKSERNQITNFSGMGELFKDKITVSHADDVVYIFPMQQQGEVLIQNTELFQTVDNIVKLWTNFAKFGNPTPDASLGVQWMPYSMKNEDYLDIGNKLVAGSRPDKQDVEFWENIYLEYLPRCSVYQN